MIISTLVSILVLFSQIYIEIEKSQEYFKNYIFLSSIGLIIFLYIYHKYYYKKRHKYKFELNTKGFNSDNGMTWRNWYLVFIFRNIITANFSNLSTIGFYLLNIIYLLSIFIITKPLLLESYYNYNKSDNKIRSFYINIIIGFIFMLIFKSIFSYILEFILSISETPINQEGLQSMVGGNNFVLFFDIVILAPIIEEIVFRGLFFRQIYTNNKFLAYLISFLIFGGVHIVGELFTTQYFKAFIFLILYGGMGLIMAYFYKRTENIFVPIGIHILNNLLGFISILN